MGTEVLYLGDTKLEQAASYLAGVMTYYGVEFDYLASDKPFGDKYLTEMYKTIIISDYPAKNFKEEHLEKITTLIDSGASLIMIGGWESFTGKEREYTNTPLRKILPVDMQQDDDRVNSYQPYIIEKVENHSIIEDLPFDEYPACINGFNMLKAKKDALTVLGLRKLDIKRKLIAESKDKKNYIIDVSEELHPLLVVSNYGKGKVAVFASDLAPHWVGGFVDWGDKRISVKLKAKEEIEVEFGNWYAQFAYQIIKWALE